MIITRGVVDARPSHEKTCIGKHGPSVESKDTEIVLLTRQRIPTEVVMRIGTDAIATNNMVRS